MLRVAQSSHDSLPYYPRFKILGGAINFMFTYIKWAGCVSEGQDGGGILCWDRLKKKKFFLCRAFIVGYSGKWFWDGTASGFLVATIF